MLMGSAQNCEGESWYFDYGICEQVSASDLIWPPQISDDPLRVSAMLEFDTSSKESSVLNSACSRKRNRVESSSIVTKASREKLRREKLNDRYKELSSVLNPGMSPKTDKLLILIDANQRLKQLRLESEKLQESNKVLYDTIKNIKEEKIELREEKAKLKTEKSRIEKLLKSVGGAPPAIPYKTMSFPNYAQMGLWQWAPPASVDISQDHELRPPVA